MPPLAEREKERVTLVTALEELFSQNMLDSLLLLQPLNLTTKAVLGPLGWEIVYDGGIRERFSEEFRTAPSDAAKLIRVLLKSFRAMDMYSLTFSPVRDGFGEIPTVYDGGTGFPLYVIV